MLLRVAAFALALASAAPALAQDPMSHVSDVGGAPAGGHGGHRGAMKACQADRQTYCAGVEKGGGRIMQCMKQHASQLSAGCKSALQEMRAERQASKGK
jgi:hypothetical protein